MSTEDIVKIRTADGDEFTVEKKSIEISNAIKSIINRINDRKESHIISVDPITTDVMAKIIKWCDYHFIHQEDLNDYHNDIIINNRHKISEWNREFLGTNLEEVCRIINAAAYLEIYPLESIAIKHFVNFILSDHIPRKEVLKIIERYFL